ncbi:hypothetical protein CsSME_00041931 [Camellia sinensis var. sinensis]
MSTVMSKQIRPLLHTNIPTSGDGGGGHLNTHLLRPPPPQKEKVVVVMGATGTGKSRLSIDLATRFPAEIVNSDKIQAYEGLNIVTNKITAEEQRGVPHHLLGLVNPNADFSASTFCDMASFAVRSISSRRKLPIIVGGSNSYIEALVDDENHEFRSRYECCFLCVDVSIPVLHSFVSNRVDLMVEMGMVEEVRSFFDLSGNYSNGIRRAIGVPEFDRYFRMEGFVHEQVRVRMLQEVIREIKGNTRKLATRQLDNIYRLQNVKGWKLHRLDATDAFRKHGKEADEAWEHLVTGPSSVIVSRFLHNLGPSPKKVYDNAAALRPSPITTMTAVMTAASV